MDDALKTQIQALAEPVLAEREMELVELTLRPQGQQQVIRLLVDKVGGVTIQQCAKVNRQLGMALEAANLIEGSYAIEVSSPGLDRPLVSTRDFERAVGEDLVVQILSAEGKLWESQGMLLAVQPDAIVLQMTAGNVTIPLSTIKAAKKAIQW